MTRPYSRRSSCVLLLGATFAAATFSATPSFAQNASPAQAYADAVRLLEQATFGPNDALITHVMQVGTQAFLNEQYTASTSAYPTLKYVPAGQQAT